MTHGAIIVPRQREADALRCVVQPGWDVLPASSVHGAGKRYAAVIFLGDLDPEIRQAGEMLLRPGEIERAVA